MPRQAKIMSARSAAALSVSGFHAAGGVAGLLLKVSQNGAKSWVFRYRLGGERRWMGLGSYSALTLAAAREKANRARLQVLDGVDPIAFQNDRLGRARAERAKLITFAAAAEHYAEAHAKAWTPLHRRQFTSSLANHALPVLGPLPVAAIDTPLVLQVIEPLWREKTDTGARLRNRIEAVLDWATARGYRQGENPARWKGHIENLLPKRSDAHKTEHHAALDYRELSPFMVELRQREGIAARALEWLILTAARSGEVLGAQWSEIDLGERVWSIPADRMKEERPRASRSAVGSRAGDHRGNGQGSEQRFPLPRRSRRRAQQDGAPSRNGGNGPRRADSSRFPQHVPRLVGGAYKLPE
jgi:integrase